MPTSTPTNRENFFHGMSDTLLCKLKKAFFPSDFEVLIAVTKDGNAHVIGAPDATFVEYNQNNDKWSVIKVPKNPCSNSNNDLVSEAINKEAALHGSSTVSRHTKGKVAVESNAISITICDKSHYGSSGGGWWFY